VAFAERLSTGNLFGGLLKNSFHRSQELVVLIFNSDTTTLKTQDNWKNLLAN
jgi:hypothetical protein